MTVPRDASAPLFASRAKTAIGISGPATYTMVAPPLAGRVASGPAGAAGPAPAPAGPASGAARPASGAVAADPSAGGGPSAGSGVALPQATSSRAAAKMRIVAPPGILRADGRTPVSRDGVVS